MEAISRSLERADVSTEEELSNELVKRIRKLRWIGMEEEAEQLQMMLRKGHQAEILLSSPCDTD